MAALPLKTGPDGHVREQHLQGHELYVPSLRTLEHVPDTLLWWAFGRLLHAQLLHA